MLVFLICYCCCFLPLPTFLLLPTLLLAASLPYLIVGKVVMAGFPPVVVVLTVAVAPVDADFLPVAGIPVVAGFPAVAGVPVVIACLAVA
jgi:hypothetical protein